MLVVTLGLVAEQTRCIGIWDMFVGQIECQCPDIMAVNLFSLSLVCSPVADSADESGNESDAHDRDLIDIIVHRHGDKASLVWDNGTKKEIVKARAAFDSLIRKHHARIFRTLLSYKHDSHLAEELTQDVVVKLLRKLHTYNGESKFTTWLTRIIRTTFLSYVRSSKVRHKQSLDAPFSTESTDTLGDQLSESEPNDAERIESKEDIALMKKAFKAIPQSYQEIIRWCDLDGRTYEQIAESLCCPVGTVKSRLSRARAALAAEYNRLLGP